MRLAGIARGVVHDVCEAVMAILHTRFRVPVHGEYAVFTEMHGPVVRGGDSGEMGLIRYV